MSKIHGAKKTTLTVLSAQLKISLVFEDDNFINIKVKFVFKHANIYHYHNI